MKKMCEGGLYDHLGGGFHRYSVDLYWRVPHFEKMLYDQAQISASILDAYCLSGKKFLLNYATETLDYVLEKMTSENGGFYSAEDAESAIEDSAPDYKEEGFYYLWEKNRIEELLGKENSQIFSFIYGIKFEGNTISDPHNVFKNKNVLYIASDVYETATKFNKTVDDINKIIYDCKNILLNVRSKRPKPHLDDKILTSWNSLMISAFTKGYNVTREEKYLAAAVNASRFLINTMLDSDNKVLYHRFRDGEVKFSGSLDDYAYFVKAMLDLYETTFDTDYLQKAILVSDFAIEKFYDEENYAFFDSEKNSKDIILPTKEIYDGAEPSGNSIMIEDILRLFYFTENENYLDSAEKSLKYFYTELENLPFSSPNMLGNLMMMLGSPKEIIFTGDLKNESLKEMLEYVYKKYIPHKIMLHADSETEKFSGFIKNIIRDYNSVKFYICENKSCKLPADNLEDLKKLI
jgi:uncharacterized protein YyaL (SSP411 family)